MIAIADSGSSKTDGVFILGSETTAIETSDVKFNHIIKTGQIVHKPIEG